MIAATYTVNTHPATRFDGDFFSNRILKTMKPIAKPISNVTYHPLHQVLYRLFLSFSVKHEIHRWDTLKHRNDNQRKQHSQNQ